MLEILDVKCAFVCLKTYEFVLLSDLSQQCHSKATGQRNTNNWQTYSERAGTNLSWLSFSVLLARGFQGE